MLSPCLTQNCEYVAKEDRMCTAPSCAKECTRDFTIGNWYEPSLKLQNSIVEPVTCFKGTEPLRKPELLFFIKRACTVAPQVEKAWPRPIAKALLARVPRIGAYKASFPRPIACGAGFSLWRRRVERAVRSHSLRAWAIGRAQMAMPSKECTLLHTIYNTGTHDPMAATPAGGP